MKTFLYRVTLGVAITGLAGCNSLTGDAFDTLKLAYSGPEPAVKVEHVQAVDQPVLIAEFGVADAMLVSQGQSTGLVEWYGITEMFLTHGGRIVQTAGLPVDPIVPLVADDPFLLGLHTITDGMEVERLVDYPALYQTGLRQHARYRIGKIESITFMGSSHQLLRIDEHIRMPELDYSATNHYWIEPRSGLVRHSLQHLAPDLPPLRLTLAKTQGTEQP